MMSDHWKILANILGTPGPAEPVATDLTKKRTETEIASPAKDNSSFVSPTSTSKRDPLAEIVESMPDPTVPGFDVPERAAAPAPPAKRSAWDTLIGTLGIKSVPDEVVAVKAAPPRQEDVRPAAFAEPVRRDEPLKRQTPSRGFGSGLVNDPDADDEAPPTPVQAPMRSERRPPRPSRDEPARPSRDEPARPSRDEPARVSRNEPARASRDEPKRTDAVDRAPRRSSEAPKEDRDPQRSARSGFADGLIDWDDVDDGESIFVGGGADDLIDDDDEKPETVRNAGTPRDEDSQGRGRGRRGGSRNRGREDRPREDRPRDVEAREPDAIGWDAGFVDDDEPAPARNQTAPTDSRGRREPRESRGNSGRQEPSSREPADRDAPRRETSERGGAEREVTPRRERDPIAPTEKSTADEDRQGGRRGQRQRMSVDDSSPRAESTREPASREPSSRDASRREPSRREPSRGRRSEPLPDIDFVDDDMTIDDDVSVVETSDAGGDETDQVARPRRRRGRRGRGGRDRDDKEVGRQASSDDVDDGDVDESESFGAEIEPEFLDDADDLFGEIVEPPKEEDRPSRGRRRPRGRGDARDREITAAADSDRPASEPAGVQVAAPGARHRNVPTWLDTINLLVDSNIERHKRTGGSQRSPQGRGGRSDRDRDDRR